jgi:peptide/nickel transport system substrate-binding protein
LRRAFAAVIVAALALGGCSRQGASYLIPDTLRIAIPIAPTQLNPILTQNTSENFIDGLMFSLLVEVNDKGEDVPELASVVPTVANGGISKDGRTITYHLRHGVKWQDGYPFTSKDVVFTWHAIMNPKNNAVSHVGYEQIASMDTPDAYTVVMHMKKVYSPAVDTIFGESDSPYRILPEHLLAKYPSLNHVAFNSNPIGTGPFRFVKWLRGDEIVLAANPTYFRGKPKIGTLVLKIIPDGNTTEAELRAHEVDLALEIEATTYEHLKDDPGIVRYLARVPSFTAIFFNTSRPPLDDVRVRRAIALAIDRNELVRSEYYGTATLAVADLSPYYWAFDKDLQPLPYDVKQAGKLLDQAGWRMGRDGMRRKNGRPLALEFAYGTGSQSVMMTIAQVQQMLKGVGVEVDPKGFNYAQLYAAVQSGGIITGGKFDMTMYAWVAGADPDDSNTWLSTMVPPAGNNVTRYKSSEMDAAQKLALSTFDRSVRKRAYAKIESLLVRDVPGAFIGYRSLSYAYVPQLQNFKPNGVSEGWNAYDWQI